MNLTWPIWCERIKQHHLQHHFDRWSHKYSLVCKWRRNDHATGDLAQVIAWKALWFMMRVHCRNNGSTFVRFSNNVGLSVLLHIPHLLQITVDATNPSWREPYFNQHLLTHLGVCRQPHAAVQLYSQVHSYHPPSLWLLSSAYLTTLDGEHHCSNLRWRCKAHISNSTIHCWWCNPNL